MGIALGDVGGSQVIIAIDPVDGASARIRNMLCVFIVLASVGCGDSGGGDGAAGGGSSAETPTAESVCEKFCACLDEVKNGCSDDLGGCIDRITPGEEDDKEDYQGFYECVDEAIRDANGECADLSGSATAYPSEVGDCREP